jgi:hypothetical protein
LTGYISALSAVEGMIAEQPKVGEWIPIGQFPNEPCLLCFENGTMVVGYYDFDEWKILSDSEYETNCLGDEPVAWMPLPEPYKEEVTE